VAETLAVVGSILLLLGVTGGIQGMATKLFSKDEFVPLGDRIWATLIGGTLVGLAVVLETGSKRGLALWIMLGIGAVIVTGYSGFLWSEYRHDKEQARRAGMHRP
jgi:drug/metabolite transporter (DMT)-like permease